MYYYSEYNLIIASEVKIKALIRLCETPPEYDVKVSLGNTPATLSHDPLLKNVCAEMNENEFLFFHKTLGLRFFVRNGNEVIIDEKYNKDPDMVSVFFLGSIIGAVLYMRNMIPFHASTVMTEKGAVLFSGVSGAGKSTLAFALMNRGYRLIGDDMAPIRVINQKTVVFPGFPRLKLWQDSLDLNQVSSHDFPRVRSPLAKYYVDFDPPFDNSPVPVTKIFHLAFHNRSSTLTIEKTKAADRLNIIHEHTYRKGYVRGLKKEKVHFEMSAGLAGLPMSTITRPLLSEAFNDFINSVEEAMLK